MTKVVVIGSNSFAASHFIDFLLTNTSYQITGISRGPEANPIYLPYKKNQNLARFSFHKLDVNKDMPSILNLLDEQKPEIIVNFSAQNEVGPSWDNPSHWFKTNTLAVVNLANHLKSQSYLKKYVHISSPEVYGSCQGNIDETAPYNPSTPYAASKASADMFIQVLIKGYKFPAIIIRSTNYYGPGQKIFKIIPRSIIYMRKNLKIGLDGGGKAVKSYIHITDVSCGILKAMQKGTLGQIYHLSPKSGYAVREIVQKICDKMNMDFNKITEIKKDRKGQDPAYVISSQKALSELSWKPKIDIDSGLDQCIDWVNQNWEIVKNHPLNYEHSQ